MRATRTLVVVVVSLLLGLLTPLAYAQTNDLDCSDFKDQVDAQRVLDRDSTDPNRLDGDGDGVACGSKPKPSAAQIAVYVAVALIVALTIGLAVMYWVRRSRGRPRQQSDNLDDQLRNLQEHLKSVRAALLEIDEAVDSEQNSVRELQINASRARELSNLTSTEVDAVRSALQDELTMFDRSTLRATIISSLATSAFGVASSILINLYVP